MVNKEPPKDVVVGECRCCLGPTTYFSTAEILEFSATYEKCENCGTVQVRDPFWINDVHQKAISNFDTGLVSRCVSASRLIGTILFLEGEKGCTGIDWGGGTGLLTRLLRDQGFRTRSYDKYASNELAQGFSASLQDAEELACFMSAIECFEHLDDPIESFKEVTKNKKYFIFTTELIDTPPPDPSTRSWWYYMPESGQHITFASIRGMIAFSQLLGFDHYFRIGNMHVLSRSKYRIRTRLLLKKAITRRFLILFCPELLNIKYSLVVSDMNEMLPNL